MDEQIVYKVVYPGRDGLISCSLTRCDDLCLDYRKDRWTIALVGTPGIYAFGDKDKAICFAVARREEVYEAKAMGVTDINPVLKQSGQLTLRSVRRWWRAYQAGKQPKGTRPAPLGTVLCQRLRLVRRII